MSQKLRFDFRGLIEPARLIQLTHEEFKHYFVQTGTRKFIYDGFIKYIHGLKKIYPEPLTLWIDGSFTTLERYPNDIDVCVFLDYRVMEEREHDLRRFKSPLSEEEYGVDAYFIRTFPEAHPSAQITELDKKYWYDWWIHTRPRRKNLRLKKGFIEVIF
ncbi:MAG: hypothetical protein MUC87_04925 [Bacteroidia bacterium]|jgi:hypothetical protein|nr:hypothetical protein [Bacteroidia bacterium]